jgi:O-antigen/teichoic acid export membrane protein
MSKAVLGKYDIAYRLIYLILTFSAGLGGVMLPRISNTFSKGDNTKIITYLKMSMSFVYLTAIPFILGIYLFSEEFVKWFLGPHFTDTNNLMIFLSPMILINSISGVLAYQYMIPTGKEKKYIISLILGLVLSTISAYILIPKYSAVGACIVIVINEIAILFGHLIQLRSDKITKGIFSEIGKFALSGVAMTLFLYISLSIYKTNLLLLVLTFVFATLIYFLSSFLMKTYSIQYIFSKLLFKSK